MKMKTLSVSEVNHYMKRLLQADPLLNHLSVKGEISNYKANPAGYAFFTLKDAESKISCVIFSNRMNGLAFIPENGMAVTVKGNISLYEKSGVYQIYVNEMEPSGTGDLFRKFEELKIKLGKKGYFSQQQKKELPFFPKKIAIVTSSSGAALRDVLNVAKRRNKTTMLYIYPSLVQGIHAAENLAENIRLANCSSNGYDLIILTRGGGSIEELWAFNEEVLCEAIHISDIPVVSAVGHETDFTISDFTSDFRAPTPSAAAELCLPDTAKLTESIESLYAYLERNILRKFEYLQNELLASSPKGLAKKLSWRFENERKDLQYLNAAMYTSMEHALSKRQEEARGILEALNRANPDSILRKGYAIVYNESEKVVSSVEDVNLNECVTVVVKNGKIKSRITSLKKEMR
ncbi:MAG: exodeoxyribonuclease VII large subunit [Peptostreptococcaceae bacterium]|nr:exodeoxyribonuclease VII large subunit [Peptostreptococcaceae bacterium]